MQHQFFHTAALALLLFAMNAHAALKLVEKSEGQRVYAGEVQLSGTYRVDYSGSDLDGTLFFIEDAASHAKLPSNDFREGLIGLNPPEEGKDKDKTILAIFQIPEKPRKKVCSWEGTATIVIKKFIAVRAGSESGDQATLVRIISKTKPDATPCN